MFAHLHVRSTFSFLSGGSSPEDLVTSAKRNNDKYLALTDVNGVYGVVRFLKLCKAEGIVGIVGAEVTLDHHPVVLLAQTKEGYACLCDLLTKVHLADRKKPGILLENIPDHQDLICLSGGRESLLRKLVSEGKIGAARSWLERLSKAFPHKLYVELANTVSYGDRAMIDALYHLSQKMDLPVVATNDVRYAESVDYRRYDLLTCIRLGIKIHEPHAQRPTNAEAYLKDELQLRPLIPYPEAFINTIRIAESCNVELVPEYITPPAAILPDGMSPRAYLNKLCGDALLNTYPADRQDKAVVQYNKEFGVITSLGLEEYFLVVREVVNESRKRGIRCAGRGSAANSIVAYLLGITGVDPIRHNLLFERFLHSGRKGTPDIDIDFDSERRDEIIEWVEQRFGIEQTAMTATLITYQLRMAIKDVAKTLGWPLDVIDKLTPAIPSRSASEVRTYRNHLSAILGESPLFELLITMVEGLAGIPRHLGLHAGGMVLSRKPLRHFTPVQVSANGVKVVQFDKNDVEALGLVKLDVLGLRMLATLSEAAELVAKTEEDPADVDAVSLEDEEVYDLICSDSTIGLFQIESQGQIHLLAVNQPRNFDDLIAEIALFRPGPLQGGMVHPFVRRRKGTEPIEYEHPDLIPALKDTYGIILFQEQVLEVAHRFAGMSLAEADDFRALMSKYRDPDEMESMRDKFVGGAMERGIPQDIANSVFDKVSKFVGYGFCRSHAAAFARIVYQSAWMKRFYPAAYMAAVMQHRPGMYSLMTLEQETRRCEVPIEIPDINRSLTRYDLMHTPDHKLCINKPLTAIDNVTADMARAIVWERMNGVYKSVEELYQRVKMPRDALDNLAKSGALDSIANSSRGAMWDIGVLARRLESVGDPGKPDLFDLPVVTPPDVPELPDLSMAERLTWDYQTHHAGRIHPLSLIRRALGEFDILPIATCRKLIPMDDRNTPTMVIISGIIIMRQRPPTAKGMMFLTLEDETGFLQCVLSPPTQERFQHLLTLPSLTIRGILQAAGHWRGMVVTQVWGLKGMLGGYAGFPGQAGGRDRWIRAVGEEEETASTKTG
jgi:error-prone DNA polymerase